MFQHLFGHFGHKVELYFLTTCFFKSLFTLCFLKSKLGGKIQVLATLLLNFAESVIPEVLILGFTVQPNLGPFAGFMLTLTLLKVCQIYILQMYK